MKFHEIEWKKQNPCSKPPISWDHLGIRGLSNIGWNWQQKMPQPLAFVHYTKISHCDTKCISVHHAPTYSQNSLWRLLDFSAWVVGCFIFIFQPPENHKHISYNLLGFSSTISAPAWIVLTLQDRDPPLDPHRFPMSPQSQAFFFCTSLRIICKAGNLGHSMLRVYRFHGPEPEGWVPKCPQLYPLVMSK